MAQAAGREQFRVTRGHKYWHVKHGDDSVAICATENDAQRKADMFNGVESTGKSHPDYRAL